MKAVLSCGGTGGHIYPAIAIADKIRERIPDAQILFIGTQKGMENTLVPKAGYDIKSIDSRGFDRKHVLSNYKTIQKYFEGSHEVAEILKEFGPDVCIGTGGYVTGPVISQAHKQGIRCFLHEQNALPGLANRFLSRFAEKVFASFDGTQDRFKHPDRVIVTGNPIRSGFMTMDRDECRRSLGIPDTDKMILVFGGSLGAETINRETLGLIDEMSVSGVKLYFVTGRRYFDRIKGEVEKKSSGFAKSDSLQLLPYTDEMPRLMCASDVVISRSGAIAVSEIAACGKPSILIPSPNVTDNHQYYNAKAMADGGASVLLEEKDLPEGQNVLAKEVLRLLSEPESLKGMAASAKAMSRINAADLIFENLGLNNE